MAGVNRQLKARVGEGGSRGLKPYRDSQSHLIGHTLKDKPRDFACATQKDISKEIPKNLSKKKADGHYDPRDLR